MKKQKTFLLMLIYLFFLSLVACLQQKSVFDGQDLENKNNPTVAQFPNPNHGTNYPEPGLPSGPKEPGEPELGLPSDPKEPGEPELGLPSGPKEPGETVRGEGPTIEFLQAPVDHKENEESLVSFLVTDPDGVDAVQCQLLNNEEPKDCGVSHSEVLKDLSVGKHSFRVMAIDNQGHISTKSHSWYVNTEDVICDPFKEGEDDCSSSQLNGLTGYIYYLPSLGFGPRSLVRSVAKLDDYLKYGKRVPTLLHMSQINIPARGFRDGFRSSNGDIIQDVNGNTLHEWFSLRLSAVIVPNRGSKQQAYEFATLSDDGMRVVIDGKVILNDDGLHSPRWKCSSQSYVFAPFEEKKIEIHYFQGPAHEIAMTLRYRVKGLQTGCPYRRHQPGRGWKEIPPEVFSSSE